MSLPMIQALRTAGLLTLLVLLAAPQEAVPQSRPAAADTIRLRFNWPVGKTATVETTRFRERITETTDTFAGGARYRMQVRQHADGLLIVHDSFNMAGPTALAGQLALQVAAERIADLVPSYVVTREGEFLRIDSVEALRARMSSLFSSMLQPGDSTGQASGVLASLTSESVLNSIAAQEWNALVGMWIEADLALGEKYELEEEAPIPFIPGAMVTMQSEFSIVRRVPCRESGSTPDCVEIRLMSRPDGEEVQMLIRRFMDRIAAMPGATSFGFESLDLENELVLIIEPATLLPHRARLSKRVKGVVVAQGKKSDVSQLDVRTYAYSYR
jgi:hypothetical protein